MKTSEEKIHFKNHFFKLGQGRLLLRDDIAYWRVFWCWPEAALDVFDLLTPYDIQTVRDQNLPNFLTLVYVLCSALLEGLSALEFQNCARMLAKVLPFFFEMPEYADLERRVFLDVFDPMLFAKTPYLPKNPGVLSRPAPAEPVAPALVRALVSALAGKGPAIWELGIGRLGLYAVPDPSEALRADTLRLLLVLISRLFYESAASVVRAGNIFLTLLVAGVPEHSQRALVCSLINVVCRSGRVSRGDAGFEGLSGPILAQRHAYVQMCGQLLGAMVLYAVPESHVNLHPGSQLRRNAAADFLSGIHKASELSYVSSHLLALLRSSVNAENGSSGPAPQETQPNPAPLTLVAMVILWELYERNSEFQKLVGARLAPKLVPYVLYHIYAFYDRPEYEHLVKAGCCFLVGLSGKSDLMGQLLLCMREADMEHFPPEFRVAGPVSTRDFSVIHVCQILLTLALSAPRYTSLPIRQFLLSRLTEYLYNVLPCTSPEISGTENATQRLNNTNPGGGLLYRACTYITSVLGAFSTRDFLSGNSQQLALLLRSLCSTVTKNSAASRMVLLSFLENEALYDGIWTCIQDAHAPPEEHEEEEETEGEGAEEAEEREEESMRASELAVENTEVDVLQPVPPAGMSEQRRQKYPQETPLSETWGGSGSLRVIVVLVVPFLKQQLGDLWWRRSEKTAAELFAVAQRIQKCRLGEAVAEKRLWLHYDEWPDTPVHQLTLTWGNEGVGWMWSVLGWDIYAGADIVQRFLSDRSLMGNLSLSLAMLSKFSWWESPQEDTASFSTNLWASTNTLLFRQKTQDRRVFGLRLGLVGLAASVNELTSTLARKFRMGSRSSASGVSTPSGMEEIPELPRLTKRDSVSSLHSLNTLNRARSYTPRSSMSNS